MPFFRMQRPYEAFETTYGKLASALVSSNLIVVASIFLMPFDVHAPSTPADFDAFFGSKWAWKVATTSSAVSVDPSWNLTSVRILNVQVFASVEAVQLFAMRGTRPPFESRSTSHSPTAPRMIKLPPLVVHGDAGPSCSCVAMRRTFAFAALTDEPPRI